MSARMRRGGQNASIQLISWFKESPQEEHWNAVSRDLPSIGNV